MSKKGTKFDLAALVKSGAVKEGDTLCFVSDATKTCKIEKCGPHEYKVRFGKDMHTIHTVAQAWLAQDPPVHASKCVRTAGGKCLYDLWQDSLQGKQAA